MDDSSGLDRLLADMEGLVVEPAVSTPAPTTRGKSTRGGEAAKRLTTLFRSPSAFAESARFATEGSDATECLGRIGRNGQKFCIVKGCDTKHQGGKFVTPPNHLFIKSSSTEAFCAPSADATKVPVGQIAELLSLSKPVAEWVDVFSVLESAEEDEVSLGEVDRKLEFLGQAKAHRTPAKGPALSESAFAERQDLEDILEEVPDEITRASGFQWSRALPEDFVGALEVLGRTVNALSATVPAALSEASVRAATAKGDMVELFDRLNARLISLEGATGSRPEPDEDLPPTLWETAGALWAQSLSASTPETASTTPLSVDGMVLGNLVSGMSDLKQQMDSTRAERRGLNSKLADLEARANRLFEAFSKKLSSVVLTQNDLTREVSRLSQGGGGGSSKSASAGLDAILASLGGKGSDESVELADLRKEVEALRKEVRNSKDKEGDKAVEIAGLTFRTKEDFAAWIRVNAPGIPFGPVVDYHGLMQQVYCDMSGYESVESLLKGLKLRNDMNLSTTGDILALAAIRSGIPQVLGEGKTPTGEDRSSFHAFHTFADWKNPNGRDGFVHTLPSHQHQAVEAIREDIETRMEPGSPAAMLASTCLTKSSAFSDALVTYLTRTYEDLTQASGFAKKRAWALTTALGARICKEVHRDSTALARSLSVSAKDTDRERLTVRMLWAALRAHMIIEEYVQAEFKDHPTVASEYVKFLATNSGYETVAALQRCDNPLLLSSAIAWS
jgi:hypothetical protein